VGHISSSVRATPNVFIHESAYLYGRIQIGEHSSIWPNVVARAEVNEIRIGAHTNIQDFVMIHVGYDHDTIVGDYCSITHHCTLHGCTIEDNCLIGINATIADGCVIGENSIIGAHTYLKEGTIVPPNSLVVGMPGKVIRTQNSFVANRINAFAYTRNAQAYREGNFELWATEAFQAEMRTEMKRLAAQNIGS
jgi:carbonic anhydrase/acetyltransferase-like protein (isoleucine patch superfamily)